MNNVAQVRKLLADLVESTASPVYAVCEEIASYLEDHPKQRNLTIGGLRAALKRSDHDDNVLIQGAFTLVSYPFLALDVRYKLYDEKIKDVLEEFDHPTYMKAVSEQHFIDEEGNDLAIEELNARIFPYFVNRFQHDDESQAHVSVRAAQ